MGACYGLTDLLGSGLGIGDQGRVFNARALGFRLSVLEISDTECDNV